MLNRPNEQTADQGVGVAQLLEKLTRMESEIAALREREKAATTSGTKLHTDDFAITKAWAQEWLNEPVVDTEFIMLGCDKFSTILEPNSKTWNKETNLHDPIPECYFQLEHYTGPIPKTLKTRYKHFCVGDISSHPNVEITEDDLSRFRLPARTRPRRGPHKLSAMLARLMEDYRKDPGHFMPLERYKLLVQAELESEWRSEEERARQLKLVERFDEVHTITGQIPPALKKEIESVAGV